MEVDEVVSVHVPNNMYPVSEPVHVPDAVVVADAMIGA
jgi:hypothetical protein